MKLKGYEGSYIIHEEVECYQLIVTESVDEYNVLAVNVQELLHL